MGQSINPLPNLFDNNLYEAPSSILIVEDDPDLAGYLSAILTLDGHQILEVYSAEQAIEELNNNQFDLVISDLIMPGMGGLGLLTYLKQNSNLPYIPVIILTALYDNIDKNAMLQSGADDFLTKPINKSELQARVRSLVRLKKAHDILSSRLAENNGENPAGTPTSVELTLQQQRELVSRIAKAIWQEMDQPLSKAINLAQNGLREGKLTQENLQLMSDELKKLLNVSAKLERLALEARKNTGKLSS
jgi:DNA-binding response OmpR family regulator